MEFSILTFDEIPKTLYHYTSLEGMIAIVQTRRLRASSIGFLNDESEALRLKESVIGILKERHTPSEEEEMMRQLCSQIEVYSKQSMFVASLSARGDLLSQWRAYCPPGQGVSIGFASEALVEQYIANQAGGSPYFLSAPFQKVRYYKPEHGPELRKFLERLLTIEREDAPSLKVGKPNNRVLAACMWPAEFHAGGPENTQVLENVTNAVTEAIIKVEGKPGFNPAPPFAAISGWVSQLAPFIKHEAFEEECEWRKVISKDYRLVPGQRFRMGRSTIIPFIEIMLDV